MMPRHALAPVEAIPFTPTDHTLVGTPRGDIGEMAAYVQHQESLPDGQYDPDKAGFVHDLLLRKIDRFRDELSDLTSDEQQRLNPYVQSLLPRHDIYQFADGQRRPTVKTVEHMDVDGIVNFSRRHVAVLEELRVDATPFISGERLRFLDTVEEGIAVGWISPSAANMEEEVLSMPIRINDWWDTRLRQEYGRFSHSDRSMTLAQGLGATRQARLDDFMATHEETIPHELWHSRDISDDSRHDWLVEAGAEHVSLSMVHGEPDILRPENRTSKRGTYKEYRSLTAEMVDGLDDPFIFTRAITSGSMDSDDYYELNEALYQKYKVTEVVERVSNRLARYQDSYPDADAGQLAGAVEQELRETPWVVLVTNAPAAAALWRICDRCCAPEYELARKSSGQ